MFRLNKTYLLLFLLLFIIEVFIALYVHDRFVRPYFGDFLVVILIYCFIRSFFNFSVLKSAIGVLVFAYLIELFQLLNMVKNLGLEKSKLANVIIGTSFEWVDILAYTLGTGIVVVIEKLRKQS